METLRSCLLSPHPRSVTRRQFSVDLHRTLSERIRGACSISAPRSFLHDFLLAQTNAKGKQCAREKKKKGSRVRRPISPQPLCTHTRRWRAANPRIRAETDRSAPTALFPGHPSARLASREAPKAQTRQAARRSPGGEEPQKRPHTSPLPSTLDATPTSARAKSLLTAARRHSLLAPESTLSTHPLRHDHSRHPPTRLPKVVQSGSSLGTGLPFLRISALKRRHMKTG